MDDTQQERPSLDEVMALAMPENRGKAAGRARCATSLSLLKLLHVPDLTTATTVNEITL